MSDLELAPARIGTTLRGKWTLEKLLGEGGMASVYVARHKIGRLDAIKILHPTIASSPQLRARFEQEAHVVNRFRHPGAVEIHDIDTTEDGAPFLVMELLDGETLSAIARRTDGPLDVATVLRVADEVLDVLAAAHAHGIIHRDIKPDNLLRLKDGRIKVLDFGIARVREGLSQEMKTRTGTTLGTVSYMPPEQAKGTEIDARADLYAVGATVFRLLSGRRVHEADTEVERLMKVVSEPAPPLASIAPHVPAAVCAVVDRALAFDRERRYPDAATMQADVRTVARGETAPSRVAAPAPPAKAEAATRAEMPIPAPVQRAPTAVLPQWLPAVPPHEPPGAPSAIPPYRPPDAPSALPPPRQPAAATVVAPVRPQDAATRFAPGVVYEAPTVTAAPLQSPAMLPTAVTRAVFPAAPVRATPASKALVVALVAGAALGVLLLVGGAALWLSARSTTPAHDDVAPTSSSSVPGAAAPTATVPALPAQAVVPPVPTTAHAPAPPPPAPPPPAPPGHKRHGH
jgi:serine/threonine-protein kinase